MHGDEVKQFHDARGIDLRVAAIARADGMLRIAQVHEREGHLIGLEFPVGEFCECLVDGGIHERLQLPGAIGVRRCAGVLGRSRGRRKGKNRSEHTGEAVTVIHTALLNHRWTQMNMDLLMGRLDGPHFLSPHPGPLPWGEGESSAVFGLCPRRSWQSSGRKRRAWAAEGEGAGEGNDGSIATDCPKSKGPSEEHGGSR